MISFPESKNTLITLFVCAFLHLLFIFHNVNVFESRETFYIMYLHLKSIKINHSFQRTAYTSDTYLRNCNGWPANKQVIHLIHYKGLNVEWLTIDQLFWSYNHYIQNIQYKNNPFKDRFSEVTLPRFEVQLQDSLRLNYSIYLLY